MSMSELLDTLTSKTQELLADQTVTIRRNDPAENTIDPETLKRITTLGPEDAAVITGQEQRIQVEGSRGFVTRKTFTVAASALTFTPTRRNTIHEASGQVWRVIKIDPEHNGRSFVLHGERTA